MAYTVEKTAREYAEKYQTKYCRAEALEKKLLKKLLAQFSGAKSVLEVGCGTAHFTKWMVTLGFEGYGVDISKTMLKEAKKRWIQSRLVQCEGTHLPFISKSLDIAIFVTSLEFMPDAQAAIAEAARVAKKGLVIGLLNKYSLSTLKKKLQTQAGKSSYYQKARFYSMRDIEQMLKKSKVKHKAINWTTTIFPKIFGKIESSILPLGAFLGISVKMEDEFND